jgi:uncharacterized protein (DUF362 family)
MSGRELKMPRKRVAVVEAGGDVARAVRRSVELVEGLDLSKGDRVVVKPNICNSKNPYGMVLTDFRILEEVLRMLQENANNIVVVESDNIAGTADRRAEETGLLELLGRLGVEFINLSEDEYEVHEVAGKKLRLPRTVLDADYMVNLPKLKTCGHTLVTLSIKNLFGVIQRAKKNKLHRRLNEILPYLAKTVGSDLIVLDGLTAMEGNGPVIGTPREVGVVVAGKSLVSVDSICSRLMGFDPSEIGHIAGAHALGLGEIGLEGIDVLGDGWERFRGDFERPYSFKASLKSIMSIRKVYLP